MTDLTKAVGQTPSGLRSRITPPTWSRKKQQGNPAKPGSRGLESGEIFSPPGVFMRCYPSGRSGPDSLAGSPANLHEAWGRSRRSSSPSIDTPATFSTRTSLPLHEEASHRPSNGEFLFPHPKRNSSSSRLYSLGRCPSRGHFQPV